MASQAQHHALDGRRTATLGQASGVQPLREAQVLRSITAATLSQRTSTQAAQAAKHAALDAQVKQLIQQQQAAAAAAEEHDRAHAAKHAALDEQVKQLIQQQQAAAAAAEERDRAHARVVAETKTALDSTQAALAAILARLPEATRAPSSEPSTAPTPHASLPRGSVTPSGGAGSSPGDGSWARTPMHSVAKRKGWTDLAVTDEQSDLVMRVGIAAAHTAVAERDWLKMASVKREFFRACYKGKLADVQKNLELNPGLATSRSVAIRQVGAGPDDVNALQGATALHSAAYRGHAKVVEDLVERSSVDVAAVNLMGRTPLHLAALSLHPEVCKVLMDAMEKSTGKRPVGVNAPVDLLGLTPAAIAGSVRAKSKETERREECIKLLHVNGDPTVTPLRASARRRRSTARKRLSASPTAKRELMYQATPTRVEGLPHQPAASNATSPPPPSATSAMGAGAGAGAGAGVRATTPGRSPAAAAPTASVASVLPTAAFREDYISGPSQGTSNTAKLVFGARALQGYVTYMEDRVVTFTGETSAAAVHSDLAVFGVFDGHGGFRAAQYVSTRYMEVFARHLEAVQASNNTSTSTSNTNTAAGDEDVAATGYTVGMLRSVLTATSLELESELGALPETRRRDTGFPAGAAEDNSGTTAVVAVVTATHIVVANLGDSRAVLVQRSSAATVAGKALSTDHKATIVKAEGARVEAAGLEVTDSGDVKVRTGESSTETLAMTRSIGDFAFKNNKDLDREQQAVIAVPEIVVHRRQPGSDVALVLACDGVWDVRENDQVAALVADSIGTHVADKAAYQEAVYRACDELLTASVISRDNLSAVIVGLVETVGDQRAHAPKPPSEAGEAPF